MPSKYLALPRDVTEATMDAAMAKFRHVLGDDAVLTAPEQLASYAKVMMPVPESEHVPSAAILATTVPQIQAIVGICNEHKVPVWTISTGKNLGYGSAAPAEAGQVVLDLHRMNRILEVDADLCYALVEPGVTYKQLHDYIAERNLPLWLSVPAPSAIAGPTGNTLDRGVGYTPYGEHFLFSCGMEVVLANGDVLRTAMAAYRTPTRGRSSSGGTGPTWTASSRSPITASSRNSASGLCRRRRSTSRSSSSIPTRTTSSKSSTRFVRCASEARSRTRR
jgi:4-cresol dehydrogenase (hydroxylating)